MKKLANAERRYWVDRGMSTVERAINRVVLTECGCWYWDGAHSGTGRPHMFLGGGQHGSYGTPYKVLYEHFVEPVPAGLELDHLCRDFRCVNPWHLEAVTHGENVRRASETLRTGLCRRGHDQEIYTSPKGRRDCRECRRHRRAMGNHA